MSRRVLGFLILISLLGVSYCYADPIVDPLPLESFSNDNVSVLNEELRKIKAEAATVQIPIGGVILWTTDEAPDNWLFCYGQAVSRSDYDELYDEIGTTYGVGDGSTTFNLPDFRGRFPLGQDDMGGSSANRVTDADADTLGNGDGDETKTLSADNLPAHTHDVTYTLGSGGSETKIGASTNKTQEGAQATGEAGSGTAFDVMNPFITLNFIIRYR